MTFYFFLNLSHILKDFQWPSGALHLPSVGGDIIFLMFQQVSVLLYSQQYGREVVIAYYLGRIKDGVEPVKFWNGK